MFARIWPHDETIPDHFRGFPVADLVKGELVGIVLDVPLGRIKPMPVNHAVSDCNSLFIRHLATARFGVMWRWQRRAGFRPPHVRPRHFLGGIVANFASRNRKLWLLDWPATRVVALRWQAKQPVPLSFDFFCT